MGRTTSLVAALGLGGLAFLLSATGAGGDEDEDGGLDAEWLAKDRAVIGRLAAALPPGDRPATEWRKALDASDTREDRRVAGNAQRLELALSGGYATSWVRALVLADRIVEVRVDCPFDERERESGVVRALQGSWGKVAVTTDDAGWHYAWSDPTRTKAYRAEIDKAFGARPETAVPAALQPAFSLLDGALNPLRFGRACYEDGSPPPGREALESLVRARATSVLRALLRSANPEGRLYASEGLLRLEKDGEALTDADRSAIRAVRASPLPILHCSGCEMSQGTAEEALRDVGEPPKGD